MKFFECEYRFCQLYRSCPKSHQVEATPHSDVDEAGMPLYFGRCEEISRTFSEVPYERIIDAEAATKMGEGSVVRTDNVRLAAEDKKELLDAIFSAKESSEQVGEYIIGALKPGLSKTYTAVNKVNTGMNLLRNEIREGYRSPHERSSKNDKLVKKALDLREELIKNGTKERNATTEACLKIEEKYGLGDYKSRESFRDAVNTIVREQKLAHGLPEYPDGLKNYN